MPTSGAVHLTLIVLHASAGALAFAFGLAALDRSLVSRRPWLPTALLWSVVAMLSLVAAAVAVRWVDLVPGARIGFAALGVLGVVMIHRARRCRSACQPADVGASTITAPYVDDVGFVLISLFDGLVIVTAIDLGAPPWVVVLAAVGTVLIGHQSIEHTKRTLVAHDR